MARSALAYSPLDKYFRVAAAMIVRNAAIAGAP